MVKKLFSWKIVLILLASLFLAIICAFIRSSIVPNKIYQFDLSEIESGVFAYRETVVSSIPADNYTMVTVCDTSGDIFTIKGSLKIVNSGEEAPYAVWEDFNIVNADKVTLYIPANTVRYLGTASASRR